MLQNKYVQKSAKFLPKYIYNEYNDFNCDLKHLEYVFLLNMATYHANYTMTALRGSSTWTKTVSMALDYDTYSKTQTL